MNKINILVDKRLEIISGLVIAYLDLYPNEKEEYDWIETYDSAYIQELIKKINLSNYPKLIEYIKNIHSCSSYSELFLFFDDDMNILDTPIKENAFSNGKFTEFANLIKEVYDKENINDIFITYKNELEKIERLIQSLFPNNFCIDDLKNFYNNDQYTYTITPSITINGGFGFKKNNSLNYLIGIDYKDKSYKFNSSSFIIKLFHEYSHSFINPLVDKYIDKFENIDLLLKECIEYGLPKCYQEKEVLLYEYFVRANSIILSSKYIDQMFLKDNIVWFKQLGFVNIDGIIEITIKNINNYEDYESFFVNEIIPYINQYMVHSKII